MSQDFMSDFLEGRANAMRENERKIMADADEAYKQLAREAAELLGRTAPGAAAIFEEAAVRGLYG